MRAHFYPLAALFVFSSGRTLAQADFRPGYILSLSGDTVRGKVDYSSGRVNYQCRFRPAEGSDAVTYEPGQLRGYGFPGDRTYQVREVPVPASVSLQPLFLEALVRGAASLYYRAGDETVPHYYVQTGNGPVRPLTIETKLEAGPDGTMYRRERPLYRGELAEAFQACPEVQRSVATLPLAQGSLLKAVRRYNACVGGPETLSAVAQPGRRLRVSWGVLVGVQASTLTMEESAPSAKVTSSSPIAAVLGGAVQFYAPALANRFRVRLEAMYARQHYDAERTFANPLNPSYINNQQFWVTINQVRVPVLLRYYPLSTRVQPFVEAGGTLGFRLPSSSNETRSRTLPATTYDAWGPLVDQTLKTETGLTAGLGLALALPNAHQAALSVRAERSRGFSNDPGLKTPITRYFLLLSYDLTKARP